MWCTKNSRDEIVDSMNIFSITNYIFTFSEIIFVTYFFFSFYCFSHVKINENHCQLCLQRFHFSFFALPYTERFDWFWHFVVMIKRNMKKFIATWRFALKQFFPHWFDVSGLAFNAIQCKIEKFDIQLTFHIEMVVMCVQWCTGKWTK